MSVGCRCSVSRAAPSVVQYDTSRSGSAFNVRATPSAKQAWSSTSSALIRSTRLDAIGKAHGPQTYDEARTTGTWLVVEVATVGLQYGPGDVETKAGRRRAGLQRLEESLRVRNAWAGIAKAHEHHVVVHGRFNFENFFGHVPHCLLAIAREIEKYLQQAVMIRFDQRKYVRNPPLGRPALVAERGIDEHPGFIENHAEIGDRSG